MRIFDLSQQVGPGSGEPVPTVIDLLSHEDGGAVLGASHGVTSADFPDGKALSLETVTLTTHTATHVDAPLHYGPACEGRPARSIDRMPLSWFFGPGALLRFDPDPERGPVGAGEMARAMCDLDHPLRPGTIALCDVGAARHWGTRAYFREFRGIGADAVALLLDKGVRVVGTDAFGLDPPFHRMLDAYEASRDPADLWPAHMLGRHREYCQIERLAGLDTLPANSGFTVSCFPIKLANCGAGWARAVAIFDSAEEESSDVPE